MYYSPTQTDLSLILQQTKDVFIKVNLLDRNYKILYSFDGNLISDNISADNQSKQRRKYDCPFDRIKGKA